MSPRITADFSGVEDSPFVHVPKGYYKLKVAKVTAGKAKNSGQPKIVVVWDITAPREFAKKKISRDFSLQPQALFAIRNMLIAHGYDIPKKKLVLDTDKWVGRECGAALTDKSFTNNETKKTTVSSEISEFLTLAEFEAVRTVVTSNSTKAVAAAEELLDDEEDEGTEETEDETEETDDEELELDDL